MLQKAEKIFPWRDPKDETAHIQAKTIKSKLKIVIRLTNFLTDRHIFIGLTRRDISDLTLFIGTLQKNLRDFIIKKENMQLKNSSQRYLSM